MKAEPLSNAPKINCIFVPVFPTRPELARAYVPFQYIQYIYPPMEGLKAGTIFPELNRPYGADPEYLVDA